MSIMSEIDYAELITGNPTLLDEITNQLGQKVKFFEDPNQDDENMSPVIAVIEDKACLTDFWHTEDFGEESDYNPCLVDGEILCYCFIDRKPID